MTKDRPDDETLPAATGFRPIEQSLPMLLQRARELVSARFRPLLRSQSLNEQQWRILRVLAERSQLELLELSARCQIQPPSLSRTVPALVERGLVKREVHPEDHRRALVSLTPAGEELFATMAVELADIYTALDTELQTAGLQDVYDQLMAFNALLAENGSSH